MLNWRDCRNRNFTDHSCVGIMTALNTAAEYSVRRVDGTLLVQSAVFLKDPIAASQLMQELKRVGAINKHVKALQLDWTERNCRLYIVSKRTKAPLFELRMIRCFSYP